MKQSQNKSLSTISLFGIIGALAVLGVILLFVSGIFDSVEVTAQQQFNNTENHNHEKSIDLNQINEINRLEEILKTNPDNHETLLKLGHLLNDNGFYERAIEKYKQYLSIHPDNVDVIVDMGVCYFELKQYDKSIATIKDAIKIDPKHQIAHFNLGIVSLANNNLTEAKKWWEKARDIDPNSNIGKKAENLLKTQN